MASFYYTRGYSRVLLSCANQGFCFLNLSGITKFKYERIIIYSFSSKNKSSRKQPIRPRGPSSLAAVQNRPLWIAALLFFQARFQTLLLHIVFPTNTLRSSKNCKVAPSMKQSRSEQKSHSPTPATLVEPTFPTFPYRNLAFNYTRNKQWARALFRW